MCSPICTILIEIVHCAYFAKVKSPANLGYRRSLGRSEFESQYIQKKFQIVIFCINSSHLQCTYVIQGVPLQSVDFWSLYVFSANCAAELWKIMKYGKKWRKTLINLLSTHFSSVMRVPKTRVSGIRSATSTSMYKFLICRQFTTLGR